MEALVRIERVTKSYDGVGTPALDCVSLEVAAGEAVAIMGPSGSGKSTLLNLIAGFDRPTSGEVTVAGTRVDRLGETGAALFRRKHVGMIFQFFNLLDDLTVADNVLLPAQLGGMSAGEAVAIMGPSGSGKSTLLNLIAGFDRPTSGEVTVAGMRVDRLGETGAALFRRKHVGVIFQFFNLLDDLTVADNVLLPAQLGGVSAGEARARVGELLEALHIERYRDAYPARLSGGERQRVAIARALVNRPTLLLADEPTGALDSSTGEEIGALLSRLHESGLTLVLVTHNPELAARYATRTVELVDGRVAGSQTPPLEVAG